MSETFLTYGRKRWMWCALVSAGLLLVSYEIYRRQTVPQGSTPMGLLYGVVGTIAIGVLMALGIRRRAYASGLGTMQGWTSAHVYVGLLTLLLIPLHAGFEFGLDIHTLAFVLLVVVVVTGIVGVALYQTVPQRLTKYEAGLQADKIDREINRLLTEMRKLTRDKSDAFVKIYRDEVARLRTQRPNCWAVFFAGVQADPVSSRAEGLARAVVGVPDKEHAAFQVLSKLMLQVSQLESVLGSQMRLKNLLEAWLYVHVPTSMAMVAAVVIHLVVVFFY
jgi:hypothetical protein